MKIILCPNSFKESISSIDASNAILCGLKKTLNNSDFVKLPIADGGDGSLEVFQKYVEGVIIDKVILSPNGKKIISKYLLFDNGRSAFIELSNSSGLKLVETKDRNPFSYNSYGTGQIILSAIKKGAKKIIIALGGSATVDGGTGILFALGTKFYDSNGNELNKNNFLNEISKIQSDKMNFSDIEFILLTDVNNKLLGKKGASFVFAPQKGASKADVKKLEKGLKKFSLLTKKKTNRNPEIIVGGGAAGGIAAFLKVYLNAKIYKGTDFFLKTIQFDKKIKNSTMLITGEGKLDRQTLYGKAPLVVAKKAKKSNLSTVALVGSVENEAFSDLNKIFDIIIPFQKKSKKYSILNAKELLIDASEKLGEIISLSEKINR